MVLFILYFFAFKNSSQVDGEGGRHVLRRTFLPPSLLSGGHIGSGEVGDGWTEGAKISYVISLQLRERGKRRAPGITY